MKNVGSLVAVTVCCVGLALAAEPSKTHITSAPSELQWGPAPPSLPKGAEAVILSGDPGKPGPFALRLRMPAGYKIPAHWHPTDEHATVIAGTFSMGMGEKFDAASTKALPTGGYALMPAEMRHFAWTKQGATVQVHGIGPFALTYVNPADDPRPAQ